MAMTPETYSARRDELLGQLGGILGLEELPAATTKDLTFVQNKLVSNVFNVVLIGEFQGGKSTTFNAICDGREISPRGSMVKTSACKVSAQNLPDKNANEYATLTWKSDAELLLTMIDLISLRLREKNPDRFLALADTQIIANINLSNQDDLSLVRECLREEWEMYCEDKAEYDPDCTGRLDILRISLLIANNVDKPEIVEFRKLQQVPIPDLARYIVFPASWEQKWEGSDAGKSFDPNEVAFSFLGGAMCYLHSPNLARLGCVITDCPGLFASPWDSDVARKAMYESDAILYLINGRTQISQGDMRALKEIRLSKQEHKLHFAVNLKTEKHIFQQNILSTDISLLRNAGFNVDESCVYLFHALLGLCSRNAKAIHDGSVEASSAGRFVAVTQRSGVTDSEDVKVCWRELVKDLLSQFLPRSQAARVDEICQDPNSIGSESGLDELLDAIEQTVISKKAEALLISGGSQLVNQTLGLLESDLLNKEDIARKTEEEFKKQAKSARTTLDLFETDAKTIIGEILDPGRGKALAYDFFDNVILGNADNLSVKVANGMADNLMTFSAVLDTLKSVFKSAEEKKALLMPKVMPVLQKAVMEVFVPAAEGWVTNVYEGRSQAYDETLGVCQRDIINNLRRRWKEVKSEDNILLSGLDERLSPVSLAESASDQIVDARTFDGLTPEAIAVKNRALILSALTAPLTALFAGIFFFGGNVLLALIFGVIIVGWIPIIISALLAVLTTGKITDAIKKKTRRQFVEKTKLMLRSQLTMAEVKSKVVDGALELIGGLQTSLHKCLAAKLHGQREVFETRCSEAEKEFKRSNSERVEIAQKAKTFRTKHVEPSRVWCEAFETAVRAELSA